MNIQKNPVYELTEPEYEVPTYSGVKQDSSSEGKEPARKQLSYKKLGYMITAVLVTFLLVTLSGLIIHMFSLNKNLSLELAHYKMRLNNISETKRPSEYLFQRYDYFMHVHII